MLLVYCPSSTRVIKRPRRGVALVLINLSIKKKRQKINEFFGLQNVSMFDSVMMKKKNDSRQVW